MQNVVNCQDLLKNHNEYINWLSTTNLFSTDEIWKISSSLENMSMKITSNFLAENNNED